MSKSTIEDVIHYQGQARFFHSWYPCRVQAIAVGETLLVFEIEYCDDAESYPESVGYNWTAWDGDWQMAAHEGPFDTLTEAQASIRKWASDRGVRPEVFNTEVYDDCRD